MRTPERAPRRRFADFVLDAAAGQLLRGGRPVKIQPQPLRVLVVLVERAGELVSRDELRAQVWDSATFVEFDQGLNYAIRQIRVALGDDAASPQFLETIKGRGYRFIAPVTNEANPGSSDRESHAEPAALAPLPSRRGLLLTAALLLFLAGGVVAAWWASRWLPGRVATGAPVTRFEQVTDLADSATAPALSPDGRVVAFIRGTSAFLTPDDVYLKSLPDGEPRRLTTDPRPKYGLAFSPDGSELAYTVLGQSLFTTYVVPVRGGEPRLMLENAAGLTWLDRGHVLFSQIRTGQHLGTVTATISRENLRELYFPAHERAMAHSAWAAPDRKAALVVEMGVDGDWTSCRLIGLESRTENRPVGPPGKCDAAAWSPDGQWMYFTAMVGDGHHLWRQRYPNGTPEQLTFGPTGESGIAMEREGRSLITSVGAEASTLWMHDAAGERQLSSEGRIVGGSQFSTDGHFIYYVVELASTGRRRELRRTAVTGDGTDVILPETSVLDFNISPDGRQVVYTTASAGGSTQLWLAPTDRSAGPRSIGATGEISPFFGPTGDILFLYTDGRYSYLGRMNADGTGRARAAAYPVNVIMSVSPSRRWVSAVALTDWRRALSVAVPVSGGEPVPICQMPCDPLWGSGGRYLFVPLADPSRANPGRTLAIPVGPDESLSAFPRGGLLSSADASVAPGARIIDRGVLIPGADPDTYAYVQTSVHRNLFRLWLP